MATYNTLVRGSSGEEVKKLQQALINAGYNVGSTGADGIYGSNTESAVRKYQQDNKLTVDGMAGNQTLGAIYKSTAAPASNTSSTKNSASTNNAASAAAPSYSQYAYDPSSNKAYLSALKALQEAQQKQPVYANSYEDQLKNLYNQIINREDFSYDLNSDMLYNQYKDQYVQQGKQAMMDTMGQAAALTGGYGSTYSQSAGQQAYNAYLQSLNDVVPELYDRALDQYNTEGEQLYNQYAMVGDMADDEYGKYQDALNQYWQNLNYLKQNADDEYSRGYENWYNSMTTGASMQQQKYSDLVSLITTTGYTPSAAELQAAGMTSAQAKAYADYYNKQNEIVTSSSGGSSGGSYSSGGSSSGRSSGSKSSSSGGYNNGSLNSSQVKTLQKALGVSTDGYYGADSKKAAGGLSADEAYAKYVKGVSEESSSLYSGWTAGDWESYFAQIRQSEGTSAAQEELKYFTSKGYIPQKMVTYAASGARGGKMGH